MAIHVQIDPLERTATLRGVHSLCAGESSEAILSGVPDADTPTLSLRVYRDATEAVQVACAVRPGTDPAEEGLVPVEGRAALRRGTLDLRTSAVSEWASEDAAAAAAAEEARKSGSKEPEARAAASYRRPDSAWLVVADSSRVWAACAVPFVLRPFDDALSPDPEVPLPSYAERAEAAARAAEQAAARAEQAAEDAESAEATGKVGRDELFDDPGSASPKVKPSLLPSYVDDVLEVAELPSSGESGKLYVVTGTNAVYRWSGSSFVEVSPSRDWSGELAAKRDRTDLSYGRQVVPESYKWLLSVPGEEGDVELLPDPNGVQWASGEGEGDYAVLRHPSDPVWGLYRIEGGAPVAVATQVETEEGASEIDFGGGHVARHDPSEWSVSDRLALASEVPAAQVNADWNAESGVARILNRPTIPTVPTPVAPSTDASAQGRPADAKATGDELAEKRGLDDLAVYESGWVLSVPGGGTVSLVKPFPSANQWESGESVGDYAILHVTGMAQWMLFTIVQGSQTPQEVASVLVEDGDPDDVEFLDFGSGYSARFSEAAAPTSDTLAKQSVLTAHVNDSTTHVTAADKATWNAKQDALSDEQLANIAAVPGKADAADLRYRIAEAGFKYQFAESAFPITYMNTITSTAVTITAGDAGDITWDVQPDGSAYVSYNGFDFAYFSSTGDYGGSQQGVDLQFNGVAAANAGEPLVQILADRVVNLITADDGTESIDIELPEAVTVDGVRYARDFFLDVDNSTNASDLALEFTALGVYYGFVTDADDDIGEMMTIAGYGTGSSGDGARARLYFTECAVEGGSGQVLFHVARVTLSADIDSTTQGGNS